MIVSGCCSGKSVRFLRIPPPGFNKTPGRGLLFAVKAYRIGLSEKAAMAFQAFGKAQ